MLFLSCQGNLIVNRKSFQGIAHGISQALIPLD